MKVYESRPEFTDEVVQNLVKLLENLTKNGEIFRSRMILRCFCALGALGYLAEDWLAKIGESLLSVSRKEDSEFFKVLFLSTVIYRGDLFQGQFEEIFKMLEGKNIEKKSVLRVMSQQNTDFLEFYLNAAKKKTELGWEELRIVQYCSKLPQPVNVAMPVFDCDGPYMFTDLVLDLLNLSQDQSFLIETEGITDLIFAFGGNIDLLISKLEFKPTEYLVNVIMHKVLSLHYGDNDSILLSSLASHIVKQNTGNNHFECRLVESIEFLMANANSCNLYSLEKLSIFLAHFISNTSFIWNWSCFIEKPLSQNSEFFLKKVLHRLIRLSYHDMVKSELPEPMHKFLIPEPEPILRFSEIEESVDSTDSQLIIDRINSRASTQAMKSLLTSKEICNSGDLLMLIFCESLFYQGAKSLQHITIYLERYLDILTGINPNHILNSLVNVWVKSPQRIELLIGKLLGYKLVNCAELAQFCLDRLDRNDIWNDLHSLEWDLLNLAVNDGKGGKIEIVMQVVQKLGKAPGQNTEKFIAFLRKHLKIIEPSAINTILSLLQESLAHDLQKLFNLVVKT